MLRNRYGSPPHGLPRLRLTFLIDWALVRIAQSKVSQLSPEQRDLVSSLAKRLGAISGVSAVALGGSYARGRALPGSDIDIAIFYSEAAPFPVQSLRELSEAVNDTAGPVVTDFYQWGPWV